MIQYLQVIKAIEERFGRKIRDFSEWGDANYSGQWLVNYEMAITGIGLDPKHLRSRSAIVREFVAGHPLITACQTSDFQTLDGVASFHIENPHGERPKLTVKAQLSEKP